MSSSHILIWLVISYLLYGLSASEVYTYPSEVKVLVHKDFVYQLNSTKAIKEVKWGLYYNISKSFACVFYNGYNKNPDICNRRTEYFGDWQNGRMWYKLKNVSLSDNGYYGVHVRLDDGSATSKLKTQLIVTVEPTFTVKPNSITTITEYKNLSISCSATGPPSPTVKWLNVSSAMATIAQGSGSAVLKIPRITRHYNGQRYKCQASNNPNEPTKEATTELQVNYKPSIDISSSNTTVESWKGNTIKLGCKWLDGQPVPTWKWYRPNGQPINSSTIDKGSEVTLTTSNGDYGLYKCQATNVAGNVVHSINVTQLFPPGQLNVTVTDIKASTATVQWSKPAYNGGSVIIGYKVEVNKTTYDKLNAQTFHRHVTDLENGRDYEVKVWARNVVGYGNATVKSFKTKITGAPASPELTIRKLEDKTSVILQWTKPADNGEEITHYTIYQKQDGLDVDWKQISQIYGDKRDKLLKNLQPGQKYSFTVTATNKLGESEIVYEKIKTVEIPHLTTTPPRTESGRPSKGRSKGEGTNANQTIIIIGAVVAVLLIIITAIISLIILKKKNIFGKRKSKSNHSAAYHNDGQSTPDSLDRGGTAVINLHDDGVPTYAAVDMSKKTKKKGKKEIPEYAVVDKSKKKKRPGEIIYADLADFNTNPTPAAPRSTPAYTETDYADISQFQKQEEQEPTYANYSARNRDYVI